jgi:NAD(P)H-flavin reductase
LSNTIFRIKLHRMKNAEGDEMIWFEHPTMPGVETGGWMTDDAGKYDAKITSEASPGRNGIPPNRPVAAVWGGAGEDALIADTKAAEKPETWVVVGGRVLDQPPPSATSYGDGCFLNKKWQKFPLVEKIVVSSDTRIYRFGLPAPDMRLGLPTGGHIFLKARINGELVMRPYSPMTDDETIGHVDLLVKVYRAGVHPAFPDGGKLSQYLDTLKIGDLIDVKGPTGEFIYKGKGKFTWQDEPRSCKCINMIAGGTGLTPCYQVLNAVLRDPADTTKVNLLYANRSPDDILAKDRLDELAAAHPDRFKLTYTVDSQPSEPWKGRVGFINKAMVVEDLLPPSDDTIVAMCGPAVMIEKACHPNLKAAGFQDIHMYEF